MFNIPADVFFRYRTDRLAIIGMVPEFPFPQFRTQVRKLLKKFPPCDTLQVFHNGCHRQFRWCSNKTMYMITLTAFKKLDGKSFFFCDLLDEFFHIRFHFGCQDLPAVFDRPYHMVVDVAYRSTVMYKVFFHTHSIA